MAPSGPAGASRTREPACGDGRMAALMDAVVSMSSELETATVLERLVTAACRLTDARYGALGVLGEHGLREFVHHGIEPDVRRRIGALPQGLGVLGHLIDVPHALRLHDLTGHPTAVGFPPEHPSMRTFLGVPVRARGAVYGNLYLTDKLDADGTVIDFTGQDEEVVVALAAAAGVAIDHARAYHLVREHERWLEAAAACTRALTGESLDDATAAVLDRVCDVAGASDGALYSHAADLPSDPTGDALRGSSPTMLAVAAGDAAGRPGPAWLLAVPLRSGGRWIGAVLLAWPRVEGQVAPPVDLPIVAGFGDQLALALDVAEAQTDRARLAVLEERERIARDLHDMVIQRLFAIGLSVQAASQDAVSDDVAGRLDLAVDELDETIKDIRAAIFRLGARARPPGFGFRHEIDAEVVRARSTLGFLPRLRTEGVTAAVPREIGQDAVAVVREALANTARHAGARSAVVQVSVGDDLVVEVRDDGVGLPSPVTRRSGLANLEERAVRHGGSLTLAAPAAGGAVLTWRVPLAVGAA